MSIVTVGPKTFNHPFFCSKLPSSDQKECSQMGYLINGEFRDVLQVEKGQTYRLEINSPGHPFYFTLDPVGAKGDQDPLSLTPQRDVTDSGILKFTVDESFPERFYYQCQNHPRMGGLVEVIQNF